ncbi:MAG: hypothetical protein NVS3B3_09290 [Aquirhabdus sp.]
MSEDEITKLRERASTKLEFELLSYIDNVFERFRKARFYVEQLPLCHARYGLETELATTEDIADKPNRRKKFE